MVRGLIPSIGASFLALVAPPMPCYATKGFVCSDDGGLMRSSERVGPAGNYS